MLSAPDPEELGLHWLQRRLRDGYEEFRERWPWRWLPSVLRARVFAIWFIPADVEAVEAVAWFQRQDLRERERGNGKR